MDDILSVLIDDIKSKHPSQRSKNEALSQILSLLANQDAAYLAEFAHELQRQLQPHPLYPFRLIS